MCVKTNKLYPSLHLPSRLPAPNPTPPPLSILLTHLSLHAPLHPSLRPQMVEHCDQLKSSLRIEPVIAPAI